MQRIHDRGNIGKLILDVEKTPTPLVTTVLMRCALLQQWNMYKICLYNNIYIYIYSVDQNKYTNHRREVLGAAARRYCLCCLWLDRSFRWPATAQRPVKPEKKKRSLRETTTVRSGCLSSIRTDLCLCCTVCDVNAYVHGHTVSVHSVFVHLCVIFKSMGLLLFFFFLEQMKICVLQATNAMQCVLRNSSITFDRCPFQLQFFELAGE